MHPRQQGDAGELAAIVWLSSRGACVSRPVLHSPDYDMIADWGDRLERVEVKTTRYYVAGRWRVMLDTRGGNQS